MKINLFLPSVKSRFLAIIMLLLGFVAFGQTTLVNYPFTGTLTGGSTSDATLQTVPTIGYYNGNNNTLDTNPTINNNRLRVKNFGDYIEISLDTRGFSNISLSFDAFYRYGGLYGEGEWNVSYNAGNGFQDYYGVTVGDTNFFHSGENSGQYSRTLPAVADNNQNLKIRIKSYQGWAYFGFDSYLDIDNIKITAGNAVISVFSAANINIPHESLASFTYDTDFGTILTSAGSLTKTYTIKNTGSIALTISSITSSGQNPEDFTVSDIPASVAVNSSATFKVTFDPSEDGIRTADILINSNSSPNVYKFNVQGRGVSCAMLPSAYKQNSFGTGTPSLATTPSPSLIVSGSSGNSIFPQNSNMYILNGSDTRSWAINNTSQTLEFGPVTITGEKKVSISFYVAAFTSDKNYGVNGSSYITLSVYNPTTNTWSNEMRLRGSDRDNTYYNYAFSPTPSTANTFEWNFDGLNTVEQRINSSNTKFSYFKLNIPETYGNQLRFRINAYTSHQNDYWLIDEVSINSENTISKTFTTANVWLPSAPNPDEKAIIKGQLNLAAGNYNVCECEVDAGGSLTLNTGANLTVQGKVINRNVDVDNNSDASKFIVADGGNLIQTENGAINTGNIEVQKKFSFSGDRKQYNYVSSPTVGTNVKSIYTGTLNTSLEALYHNENTNYFGNSAGTYIAGRALALKEPPTGDLGGTTANPSKFRGVPFNGTLDYPLAYTTDRPNVSHGYNLVGNPYPSNLDLVALYNYATNSAKIESTILFWDNRGNTIHEQQGSGYAGNSYAKFNVLNQTGNGTNPTLPSGATPSRTPTRYVSPGQGFMVRAKSDANGKTLQFSNGTMRVSTAATQFFGRGTSSGEMDRYWLSFTAPTEIAVSTAVVYFEGGSNTFGQDDSEASGSSDNLYTIAEDHNISIHGRPVFSIEDVLPLAYSSFIAGEAKISLMQAEGVFNNGQSIYLKDLQLNTITDLTQGDYTFSTENGTFTNRFEIVYEPEGTLSTGAITREAIQVYRDGADFVAKSSQTINMVEVYDASGRLISKVKGTDREVRIPAATWSNGMYILNIIQDQQTHSKKIRK